MTLQMRYNEKYEEGLERGLEEGAHKSAIRMLNSGKLSNEEVAEYSGLTLEQVLEIKEDCASYTD